MKRIRGMTQAELAAHVEAHLAKKGIQVVLSGGACVAIYSRGQYVSKDLDLINTYSAPRRQLREAMQEMGFREKGRYFVHSESRFFVEFPPASLVPLEAWVKQESSAPGLAGQADRIPS